MIDGFFFFFFKTDIKLKNKFKRGIINSKNKKTLIKRARLLGMLKSLQIVGSENNTNEKYKPIIEKKSLWCNKT